MRHDNEEVIIDLDAVGGGSGTPDGPRDVDHRHTSDAGGSRVIRRDAFRRVLAKLVAKQPGSPERDDLYARRPQALDVMPNRRHDAILINARRGDGKTTFLTDLLQLIQDVQNGTDDFSRHLDGAVPNERIGSLYSLGIVDPTLIEAKQHIVVIVIEKIKAAVDHVYERNSGDKAAYDGFKMRLYDLATGLTLLDGIGESMLHGKDWADPDFILDRGLDRAGAAGGFERAFRRYVDEACKFLRMDAFVLAIDDVDTSFDRGWPVLEALRKYLAAPQLKVVLAGDMKLYNLLVRQQQWKQMTKEFVEVERGSSDDKSYRDQIVGMIDVLQDQYLIKIARPENRLDLRNLLHYADNLNLSFVASERRKGIRLKQDDVFERYADRLFALGGTEERAIVRSTLLRLPLRSSLQALAGAWPLIAANPSEIGLGDDQPPAQLGGDPFLGLMEQALDALRSVSSQKLMTLGLDQEILLEGNPDHIFGDLSQWMTDRSLWSKMERLISDGESDGNDIVSLLIAGTLTSIFRAHPRAIVDYWLKICTIREVIDRYKVSTEVMRTVLRDDLKVAANESSIQFVSRLSAWEQIKDGSVKAGIRLSGISIPASLNLGRSRQLSYTEQLYGLGANFDRRTFSRVADRAGAEHKSKLDANQNKLVNALPVPLREYHRALIKAGWSYKSSRRSEAGLTAIFVNSLKSLESRLERPVAAVVMIPAVSTTSDQLAKSTTYSVLRLIGFIGELLDIGSRTQHGERKQAIADYLARLSLLRSYPNPVVGEADEEAQDNHEEESDEAFDDDEILSPVADAAADPEKADGKSKADPDPEKQALHEALGAWLDASAKERRPSISAIALARSWTRNTYAFDALVAELRHTKTRYLGVVMHRAIIVFLHAVGVEVLNAAGSPPTTKTVKNPIVSGEALHELLDFIYDQQGKTFISGDKIWIFDTLFTCPIWGYFLARRDSDIEKDKTNYALQIYEKYKLVMSARGIRPNYDVDFTTTNGSLSVRFDGLYLLLNTIPIQGMRSSANSSVAKELAATLAALAPPKVPSPPLKFFPKVPPAKKTTPDSSA